jgi:ethanolamine utilization protein EutP (predicted NTPase)
MASALLDPTQTKPNPNLLYPGGSATFDEKTGQPKVPSTLVDQAQMPSAQSATATNPNASTGPDAAPPALTPAQSGLLDRALAAPVPATTPTATAATYNPSLATLNPNDTVENRVARIAGGDSPVVQQAETAAAQAANARGLLNSSIAVGAGRDAAIKSALPIASQDASASLSVNQQNQAAQNAASQFNTGSQNAIAQQQLSGEQAMQQEAARTESAKQLQAITSQQTAQLETSLQQLRGNQSVTLANIEANYKQLLQSSQSSSQLFSQISASISDILKEPNIPVEQKQQLVDKQLELLKNGLAVIGGISNLDLSNILQFPATPATAGSTVAPTIDNSVPAQPAPPNGLPNYAINDGTVNGKVSPDGQYTFVTGHGWVANFPYIPGLPG